MKFKRKMYNLLVTLVNIKMRLNMKVLSLFEMLLPFVDPQGYLKHLNDMVSISMLRNMS